MLWLLLVQVLLLAELLLLFEMLVLEVVLELLPTTHLTILGHTIDFLAILQTSLETNRLETNLSTTIDRSNLLRYSRVALSKFALDPLTKRLHLMIHHSTNTVRRHAPFDHT